MNLSVSSVSGPLCPTNEHTTVKPTKMPKRQKPNDWGPVWRLYGTARHGLGGRHATLSCAFQAVGFDVVLSLFVSSFLYFLQSNLKTA